VNYRIGRGGDPESWASGIVTEKDTVTEDALISRLIDQIASRAASELRNRARDAGMNSYCWRSPLSEKFFSNSARDALVLWCLESGTKPRFEGLLERFSPLGWFFLQLKLLSATEVGGPNIPGYPAATTRSLSLRSSPQRSESALESSLA
jgi:hypothetical protein